MWTYLFGSIELFSNHKSFSLGVENKRNLWLLLHFKDLEIKSKTLIYQVNNGYRQRKNTVHPQRKMQKKHKNTAELLDYLNTKSYDIRQLEIEFTNGWKIKQRPFIQLCFYTNSTSERNDLIDKLIRKQDKFSRCIKRNISLVLELILMFWTEYIFQVKMKRRI
jgi:hypothetical protein